jgi:hypothetical protein
MPVLDKIRCASLCLPLRKICHEMNRYPIHWQNKCQDLQPQKTVSGGIKGGYSTVCLGCHNFELHAGKDGCVMQNGEPKLGAASNVKLCRHIPL